ncbi:hypothetical protein ES702_06151 [subsurface metagenome]
MDLIQELKTVMNEKGFSCDTMSKFIGCSARQVDRWLLGKSKPTFVYQELIKKGIKKVKKL